MAQLPPDSHCASWSQTVLPEAKLVVATGSGAGSLVPTSTMASTGSRSDLLAQHLGGHELAVAEV